MRFRFDSANENRIISELIDNETTYRFVAEIYSGFVRTASGIEFFRFLPIDITSANYKKKIEQVRKLLFICLRLSASPEIFIKAQFEMLMPYLKQTNTPYVPFHVMLTDKAVQRYNKYITQTKNKYEVKTEGIREILRISKVDYEKIIRDSITNIQRRISVYKKNQITIAPDLISKDVEMLARSGMISEIYIYSSDFLKALITIPDYLKKIKIRLENHLTTQEKKTIDQTYKSLVDGQPNREFL
jgi:hypothetical protein